jgi:fused signal recognition particle receptor
MNFAEKIKSFFAGKPAVSDEFFDELADLLIEGDFGSAEAFKVGETLRDCCKKEKISQSEDARLRLAVLLEEMLQTEGGPDALAQPPESGVPVGTMPVGTMPVGTMPVGTMPAVILLLGVNGVGKTTTAAKLAALYRDSFAVLPVLAAADTFRAAAIDQLKLHGERLGLRVIAHKQGGDPAAVVYDAIEAARAGKGDVVIADTAGRMHTKTALVEELRKIDRVVESKAPGARYVKYLVLDATTGRNALAQAEVFCEAVSPEAAIVTKYDSTAKGGVIFSLVSALRLPTAYLCTGEKYGDIKKFDPHDFAREFAGIN